MDHCSTPNDEITSDANLLADKDTLPNNNCSLYSDNVRASNIYQTDLPACEKVKSESLDISQGNLISFSSNPNVKLDLSQKTPLRPLHTSHNTQNSYFKSPGPPSNTQGNASSHIFKGNFNKTHNVSDDDLSKETNAQETVPSQGPDTSCSCQYSSAICVDILKDCVLCDNVDQSDCLTDMFFQLRAGQIEDSLKLSDDSLTSARNRKCEHLSGKLVWTSDALQCRDVACSLDKTEHVKLNFPQLQENSVHSSKVSCQQKIFRRKKSGHRTTLTQQMWRDEQTVGLQSNSAYDNSLELGQPEKTHSRVSLHQYSAEHGTSFHRRLSPKISAAVLANSNANHTSALKKKVPYMEFSDIRGIPYSKLYKHSLPPYLYTGKTEGKKNTCKLRCSCKLRCCFAGGAEKETEKEKHPHDKKRSTGKRVSKKPSAAVAASTSLRSGENSLKKTTESESFAESFVASTSDSSGVDDSSFSSDDTPTSQQE